MVERLQDVDAGAGEQRRDDLEGRILGGRADQGDVSGFDVRQKSVLLGLVEAMHFVHENDGAPPGAPRVLGGGHHVLDFADAAEHGAEGHEFGMRAARDQARQSGFAAAGRSPQNHRAEFVALDGHAQGLAGAQQFLLADELFERARAHAFGERAASRCGGYLRARVWRKGSLAFFSRGYRLVRSGAVRDVATSAKCAQAGMPVLPKRVRALRLQCDFLWMRNAVRAALG